MYQPVDTLPVPPTSEGAAMADHPEIIYLDPLCDDCTHEQAFWWDQQDDAGCHRLDCPLKPTEYIRADLVTARIEEISERAANTWEEQLITIETLKREIVALKAEIETPRERRGFS
jgi:hypothetical protein